MTYDLYKKYGEFRLLDTPICEYSFMVCHVLAHTTCLRESHLRPHAADRLPRCTAQGMGVGAAMTGLRPIVEGMNMGFLLLAFSQISNNAGMLHYTSGGNFKVPMVIRGPGGASEAVQGGWRNTGLGLSRSAWCRCGPPAGRGALAAPGVLLPGHPRRAAGGVQHAGERQGAAEERHPLRQPGGLLRGAPLGACNKVAPRLTPAFRGAAQHVLLYNVKGVTYDDYLQARF